MSTLFVVVGRVLQGHNYFPCPRDIFLVNTKVVLIYGPATATVDIQNLSLPVICKTEPKEM